MTDINSVILIGRLCRDVGTDERSFGYTNSGMARANFSIAVNRSYKKGDDWTDDVSYFDVVLWGKSAENLKPKLKKGVQICVKGALKQERWEKDGKSNSRVVINAENVMILQSYSGPQKKTSESEESEDYDSFYDYFMDSEQEDIPF